MPAMNTDRETRNLPLQFNFPVAASFSAPITGKALNSARNHGVVLNNPATVRDLRDPVKKFDLLSEAKLPIPMYRSLEHYQDNGFATDVPQMLEEFAGDATLRGKKNSYRIRNAEDFFGFLLSNSSNSDGFVVTESPKGLLLETTASPFRNAPENLPPRQALSQTGPSPLPGYVDPQRVLQLTLEALTKLRLDYGTVLVEVCQNGELKVHNVTTNLVSGTEKELVEIVNNVKTHGRKAYKSAYTLSLGE
jgi:hypothetical protein